jgi:hypothetical protein
MNYVRTIEDDRAHAVVVLERFQNNKKGAVSNQLTDDGSAGCGVCMSGWERICVEPVFDTLLRSPGIGSQPSGPVRQPYLSYWPARLNRLVELIPRNRFLAYINVYKYGLWNFRTIIGARNQIGIGLSYRPASVHRLTESIP